MDVRLVMFKADGTRHDYPMTKSRLVVGRTNSCSLRIPLSSVSREHCELLLDAGGIRVKDLGSSNGTYHNNKRVLEATLEPGDHLTIGPVIFTIQIDGQPKNIEPVKTVIDSAASAGASGTLTPKMRPMEPDFSEDDDKEMSQDTLRDSMEIDPAEFDLGDSDDDLSSIPVDEEIDDEDL